MPDRMNCQHQINGVNLASNNVHAAAGYQANWNHRWFNDKKAYSVRTTEQDYYY